METQKVQSDQEVIDRINSDDAVLAEHGHTKESFDKSCDGLTDFEKGMRFLMLLNKSLNGDWVPDFDDAQQYKYEPYFLGGSSGFRFIDYDNWSSYSYVGSRLCYKSRALAEHAGKTFTSWYKTVITFK